eukprot:6077567-Pleurochrysis_carterae.AAC.3
MMFWMRLPQDFACLSIMHLELAFCTWVDTAPIRRTKAEANCTRRPRSRSRARLQQRNFSSLPLLCCRGGAVSVSHQTRHTPRARQQVSAA